MKNTFQSLTNSDKFYLSLFILATATIIYGTLFPVDYDVPATFEGMDKIVHFTMFFFWTLLLGLVRFFKGNTKLIFVTATGTLFGVAIELLQHFLPVNRTADLLDFIADLIGVLVAVLILRLLRTKIKLFQQIKDQ